MTTADAERTAPGTAVLVLCPGLVRSQGDLAPPPGFEPGAHGLETGTEGLKPLVRGSPRPRTAAWSPPNLRPRMAGTVTSSASETATWRDRSSRCRCIRCRTGVVMTAGGCPTSSAADRRTPPEQVVPYEGGSRAVSQRAAEGDPHGRPVRLRHRRARVVEPSAGRPRRPPVGPSVVGGTVAGVAAPYEGLGSRGAGSLHVARREDQRAEIPRSCAAT